MEPFQHIPKLTTHKSFDDNNFSAEPSVQHTFADSGIYQVSLTAQATNGCTSDTITKPVTIYGTYAYAGGIQLSYKVIPTSCRQAGVCITTGLRQQGSIIQI